MQDRDTVKGLLPCPFCGGEAETYPFYFNEWYIGCMECRCDLGVFDTKEKAIEAWNKRVPQRTATMQVYDSFGSEVAE